MPALSMYCLWLLPETTDAETFRSQINSLAHQHQLVRFDPHVTFLSGISLDTNLGVLKSTLMDALDSWTNHQSSQQDGDGGSRDPRLMLGLDEPINGGSFYTALVYPVSQADQASEHATSFAALIHGRQVMQSAFKSLQKPLLPTQQQQQPRPYFPHLSLCYSDLDMSRLASIKDQFIEDTHSSGHVKRAVTLDKCALVKCQGEAEEWETVAVFSLNGQELAK